MNRILRRCGIGFGTYRTLRPHSTSRVRLAACAFTPRRLREAARLTCEFTLGTVAIDARPEDLFAVDEVLRRNEYGPLLDVIGANRLSPILDLGANIGCFGAAVLQRSPLSVVHSFEASTDTYRLLAANCARNAPLPWMAHHAAVWTHAGEVSFLSGGTSTSRSVSASGADRVPSVTLADAIAGASATDSVALCKMDIEGAEQRVLEQALPILSRVPRLAVEVHPRISDPRRVRGLLASIYARVVELEGRQSSKPIFYATAHAVESGFPW